MTNIWQLQASHARLQIPQFAASVDLSSPSLGLQQLDYVGAQIAGHLLGVSASGISSDSSNRASDVFARGEDLVATYSEAEDRPYSLEVYWRVTAREATTVVDLLLSLETSLLESFPSVATQTQLTADEAWLVSCEGKSTEEITDFTAGVLSQESLCVVLRPEGVAWSFVEMSHPDDQGKVNVYCPSKGEIAIQRDLAGAFLEKGVIRRLRVRGAFVPRADDLQLAGKLLNELAAGAPPLTA
ncbi:MAG: hypothetical protein GXP26_00190 [Planctomycetes bacterium]|nr:hypothetical protein [Planctomycetota bacterium]